MTTALTLLDLMREMPAGTTGSSGADVHRLAEELAASTLADWERVKEFEQRYNELYGGDEDFDAGQFRSLHRLYEQWVAEADQVLVRVRQLAAAGTPVRSREALEEAHGLALARVQLTPEKMARAVEQIRNGQTVPGKELRDELRARIRA